MTDQPAHSIENHITAFAEAFSDLPEEERGVAFSRLITALSDAGISPKELAELAVSTEYDPHKHAQKFFAALTGRLGVGISCERYLPDMLTPSS